MTKRDIALTCARVCGYHDDSATFTRLCIEARVKSNTLEEHWYKGQDMKASGVKCDCRECNT